MCAYMHGTQTPEQGIKMFSGYVQRSRYHSISHLFFFYKRKDCAASCYRASIRGSSSRLTQTYTQRLGENISSRNVRLQQLNRAHKPTFAAETKEFLSL